MTVLSTVLTEAFVCVQCEKLFKKITSVQSYACLLLSMFSPFVAIFAAFLHVHSQINIYG